jgi:hypothetical protein
MTVSQKYDHMNIDYMARAVAHWDAKGDMTSANLLSADGPYSK